MKKQIVITITPSIEINKPPHVDVQVNGFSGPADILGALNFLSGQLINQMQQAEAAAQAQALAAAPLQARS